MHDRSSSGSPCPTKSPPRPPGHPIPGCLCPPGGCSQVRYVQGATPGSCHVQRSHTLNRLPTSSCRDLAGTLGSWRSSEGRPKQSQKPLNAEGRSSPWARPTCLLAPVVPPALARTSPHPRTARPLGQLPSPNLPPCTCLHTPGIFCPHLYSTVYRKEETGHEISNELINYGQVNEQGSFSLNIFPTKSNTFLFTKTTKIKHQEVERRRILSGPTPRDNHASCFGLFL